jgi:hypothetical protein
MIIFLEVFRIKFCAHFSFPFACRERSRRRREVTVKIFGELGRESGLN